MPRLVRIDQAVTGSSPTADLVAKFRADAARVEVDLFDRVDTRGNTRARYLADELEAGRPVVLEAYRTPREWLPSDGRRSNYYLVDAQGRVDPVDLRRDLKGIALVDVAGVIPSA